MAPSLPRLIQYLLCTGLCVLVLLSTTAMADGDWTLRKDEDGIRIYTAPVPDSNFHAFRGETRVESSLSTLMAVQADVAYVTEWLKDCDVSELLTDFSPDGYYAYFQTRSPWPVKDRDYVLRYEIDQDPDSYTVKISFEAEVGMLPETDECVRLTELSGYWELTPVGPRETEVVYQVSADPGGNVPAWLANRFVVDQPFYSLKRLRERTQLDKYKGTHFDFIEDPFQQDNSE